ncbi:MAG: hypothetical protein ABSB74_01710 [Tepidisphaeraceae bacterium]
MKSWRAVFWWQFKALPFGHQGWQIDVAEFIEFCVGCRIAPATGYFLTPLILLAIRSVKPFKRDDHHA